MGIRRWIRRLLGLDELKKARDEAWKDFEMEPSKAPAAKPEGKKRRRRVTIGLDYGTHSTKVVVQTRGEDVAQVLALDPAPSDHPWFVIPSLVSTDGDRIRFGSACREDGSPEPYRSLKVELLPPLEEVRGTRRCPPAGELEPMVAAYLAWVLQRTRAKLDGKFDAYDPALNVAAPMSHIEDDELKQRYLRIIGAAWDAVFGDQPLALESGMSWETARAYFEPRLAPDRPIPDRGARAYEVLPETVAPLASLRENPDIEPGLYAMIDIGAGTSEYSVVRMGPKGADDRVLCHEDRSTRRGGDDLAGAFSDNGARDELVAEFFRDVCRTWEAGRRKDGKSKQWKKEWKRTNAVLTGGAARDEQLSARLFREKPWNARFPDFREFEWRPGWYEPPPDVLGTDLADGALPSSDRSQFHLLAVAHGLSIERMNWPEWFSPGEVKPLPPAGRSEREWMPWMYE